MIGPNYPLFDPGYQKKARLGSQALYNLLRQVYGATISPSPSPSFQIYGWMRS